MAVAVAVPEGSSLPVAVPAAVEDQSSPESVAVVSSEAEVSSPELERQLSLCEIVRLRDREAEKRGSLGCLGVREAGYDAQQSREGERFARQHLAWFCSCSLSVWFAKRRVI